MTTALYDSLLILHLLLFCYWLGGDIGVFYSSGFAADPKLGIEARMTAARIMLALDVVPRLCCALMLTVGALLSQALGVHYAPLQLTAIVLLAPAWLALELALHFGQGTPFGKGLQKFDGPFKWAVVVACLASFAEALASGRFAAAPWVGYKILLFAGIVFCSLMINRTIGPYIAGIQRLAEGVINDAETAAMAASLRTAKWAVIGIWIGLAAEAALGVIKPGVGI
jgi:hypothetical protein